MFPPTLGSDRPFQTHYHSVSGEILPNFYVKNICLVQKLTNLKHFIEICEQLFEKSLKMQKIKSLNVYWSFFETFNHMSYLKT